MRPHVTVSGSATVAAFSAANPALKLTIGYPAVREALYVIRPGSRCLGWSGCAVNVIAGWRAIVVRLTGLVC